MFLFQLIMFQDFILKPVAMTDILRFTGFFIVSAGIKQKDCVWQSAVEDVPHSCMELLRFVIVRSKTRCWSPLKKKSSPPPRRVRKITPTSYYTISPIKVFRLLYSCFRYAVTCLWIRGFHFVYKEIKWFPHQHILGQGCNNISNKFPYFPF